MRGWGVPPRVTPSGGDTQMKLIFFFLGGGVNSLEGGEGRSGEW